MNKKCLCGKDAVAIAYLPIPNISAGIKQVMEEHPVCQYHADKAIKMGYTVTKTGITPKVIL